MGGRNTEVGSCLRSVATRAECKLECDNLRIGEICSEPNVLIGRSTDPKGKRVVITALTVIGVASFFGSMVLFEHYATTRSHQADAAAGRIYRLNNHGSYVYLTRSEQWPLWCLQFGGFALFILGGVLASSWNIPTDTCPGIPKKVRDQIMSRPNQDYDKIRATYESDRKGSDQT